MKCVRLASKTVLAHALLRRSLLNAARGKVTAELRYDLIWPSSGECPLKPLSVGILGQLAASPLSPLFSTRRSGVQFVSIGPFHQHSRSLMPPLDAMPHSCAAPGKNDTCNVAAAPKHFRTDETREARASEFWWSENGVCFRESGGRADRYLSH